MSLISDTSLGDLYNLYRDYPERWVMNENNNGDITDLKNIYIKKLNIRFNVLHDALLQPTQNIKQITL